MRRAGPRLVGALLLSACVRGTPPAPASGPLDVQVDLDEAEPALAAAVQRWRAVDVSTAARRAAAYLPAEQLLRATLYPVIEPRDDSFVWELERDPALFVYIDPSVSAAAQENVPGARRDLPDARARRHGRRRRRPRRGDGALR